MSQKTPGGLALTQKRNPDALLKKMSSGEVDDQEEAHKIREYDFRSPKKFTKVGIASMLAALEDESLYGFVLRAKGYVEGEDGQWIYFDYVPGDPDIRDGSPAVTGRLCVIGSKINEQALSTLFGV